MAETKKQKLKQRTREQIEVDLYSDAVSMFQNLGRLIKLQNPQKFKELIERMRVEVS